MQNDRRDNQMHRKVRTLMYQKNQKRIRINVMKTNTLEREISVVRCRFNHSNQLDQPNTLKHH